ncbi:MAG TPA: IPT/TIG domain-containing protein [Acidimicrobiales bacterium]|nr:IPT/TIG domain-containing protein [Acidimicrobiales bacterium]
MTSPAVGGRRRRRFGPAGTAALAVVVVAGLLHGAAVPALRRIRSAEQAASVSAGSSALAGAPRSSSAKASLAGVALSFEANRGQADDSVAFLARGGGLTTFLTSAGAVLAPPQGPPVHLGLVGANPAPIVVGDDSLPGVANYLIGADPALWHTGVPTYAAVRYRAVYPGVDLVFHASKAGGLEYDFVVAPGADPGSIALSFKGADALSIDKRGDLVLGRPGGGDLRQRRPTLFQMVGGTRRRVAGAWVLDSTAKKSENRARFAIGAYDHGLPLVIDPVVTYANYIGGSGTETGNAIAVDAAGNAYLTGSTNSVNFRANAPTGSPALQAAKANPTVANLDAFIAKLDPSGTAPVYTTYFGGSLDDTGLGIALRADPAGAVSAYVAGRTASADLATHNAGQPAYGGGLTDGFVALLDPAGSSLSYGSFLGGEMDDEATSVAVGPGGKAFLTGSTCSADFPTTAGAFDLAGGGPNPLFPISSVNLLPQGEKACNTDTFVTRLDPTAGLGSLGYSTYLGGTREDKGKGIAVDSSGNAYVVGSSVSVDSPATSGVNEGFPTTPGAFRSAHPTNTATTAGVAFAGPTAGFVTKLRPDGSALDYSTYLFGGEATAVALGADGSAFTTGVTNGSDFLAAAPPGFAPFQNTSGGDLDAYVTRLAPDGSRLVASTFLGGDGSDTGLGIGVDAAGNAYVAGQTRSTDFAMEGAASNRGDPPPDAFVAKLNDAGSVLRYATSLGGTGTDVGRGVSVSPAGSAYVIGDTNSPSVGRVSGSRSGGSDAIVARIDPTPYAAVITAISPASGPTSGSAVVITGTGLSGTTEVRFGGAPAEHLSVVSDTELHLTSPIHAAGVVDVVLYGEGPPSTPTASSRFNYIGAQPTISGVFPPSGGSGGGTSVMVSGVGLSDAVTVSFGGIPAASLSITNDARLTAVAPPHPQGRVQITVTTPFGATAVSPAGLFVYAPGEWRPTGPIPPCSGGQEVGLCQNGRSHHAATLLDGPACRGTDSSAFPDYCGKVLVTGEPPAQLFDPRAGTWARVQSPAAPGAGPAAATTPPLTNATATLLDGPECQVSAADAPMHCGKVLVAGGGGYFNNPSAAAALYDPETDKIVPTGSLGQARFSHTATLLDGPACYGAGARPDFCGNVLVVGGSTSRFGQNLALASAELYDPVTGEWRSAAALGSCQPDPSCVARGLHTASLLGDGRVLVAGGLSYDDDQSDIQALASTLVYDLRSGTWRPGPPLAVGRFAQSATVLDSPACAGAARPAYCGQVLVAGGVGGGGDQHLLRSAEVFDPAVGAWAPTTTLPMDERAGHTATVLEDGRVLFAGSARGFEFFESGDPSLSAELYDPANGRWGYTSFLGTARTMHTATLLAGANCRRRADPATVDPCGSVLVTGGSGADGLNAGSTLPALDSAELYVPAPAVSDFTPGRGPSAGGTTVVVKGRGFNAATSVSFGGVPTASFTVDSRSQLTAISPLHPKAKVEVTVTRQDQTSAHAPADLDHGFSYQVSRAPPAVTGLVAKALSASEIALVFAAPASDGEFPPPADRYVVKQSSAPITDEASFDAATSLCGGVCKGFVPAGVGDELTLSVGGLDPGATYHYAVKALNEADLLGPFSDSVATTTLGSAPSAASPGAEAVACPQVGGSGAGPGQVAYSGGHYSLVGAPGGTVVNVNSPRYSWFNLGAGGSYSVEPKTQPVIAGRGYWVWSACDFVVTLSGAGASVVTLPLGAYHASMVANPSGIAPASVTGHDFAARWDPALNAGAGGYDVSGYRQAQPLAVGEGIWVFSFVETGVRIAVTGDAGGG